MIRDDDLNHIHHFGQALNQFIVIILKNYESKRLLYLRTHQKELGAENYVHLQEVLRREYSVEQMG